MLVYAIVYGDNMLPSNIELRKDDSGDIDDVVVHNPTMFRMERMNDSKWWVRIYTPHGDLVININVSASPYFELDKS
jgi:hypothetical protein